EWGRGGGGGGGGGAGGARGQRARLAPLRDPDGPPRRASRVPARARYPDRRALPGAAASRDALLAPRLHERKLPRRGAARKRGVVAPDLSGNDRGAGGDRRRRDRLVLPAWLTARSTKPLIDRSTTSTSARTS